MKRDDFMLTTAAPEKRSTFTVRVMDAISAAHKPSRKTVFLGLTKSALIALIIFLSSPSQSLLMPFRIG
ncbi:hypothetical protein IPL68_01260 [Candidatus Saccharibacteria bacterium]|nr:MAG: hypothetical protein IPL68_01260 [Candidatus Saccharibacteria bacterium]